MWIETPGRKLYAYTGGREFDASLPTVAFVHGAQHDHSVWILQSRYIAHHARSVLALDLPGHGRSEGPLPTTLAATADTCLAAPAAAGADRAAIGRPSLGAHTAR